MPAQTRGGGSVTPIVVGAAVAILAIVAVVAGVVINGRTAQEGAGSSTAVPAAAGGMGEGFVANADVKLLAGAPTLDIYEDFQCPACAEFEQVMGATIRDLAAQGRIKLVYHLKTIIDANVGVEHSLMMGNAAICAADAGKFQAFHDEVFAHVPAQTGQGWSAAQTKAFAVNAGVSGEALEAWTACVDERTYATYVESTEEASAKAGINGTPTVLLAGEKVDFTQVSTAAALVQAIEGATK
ncbi:membrane protein [Knoellia sinensis KCTC 19936]|uniref:Membrane protein n=1 Tax=Knoellia sinensis KCTC 19936 TaxID=1385520 RepID=A0A0A0JAC9_9MICO|nr:thioredoxin domain-containing protein [Knoellia sinensis]KGN32531.1 membrane protein [Knoellia sinensis KCTC 19936]